jgi:hypothetical protein
VQLQAVTRSCARRGQQHLMKFIDRYRTQRGSVLQSMGASLRSTLAGGFGKIFSSFCHLLGIKPHHFWYEILGRCDFVTPQKAALIVFSTRRKGPDLRVSTDENEEFLF